MLLRARSLAALVLAGGALAVAAAPVPGPPRAEHPRPDRVRADWLTLNGEWQFAFDDGDRGLAEGWHSGQRDFERRIVVPFAFQTRLGGIGDTSFHDVVWYRRTFRVPDGWRGRRVMLHFGAVDYEARAWVNGAQVGAHRGGHVPLCSTSPTP